MDGKSVINTIEDIIDYIETVKSVYDFIGKINGDEDGSIIILEVFEEMLSAFD